MVSIQIHRHSVFPAWFSLVLAASIFWAVATPSQAQDDNYAYNTADIASLINYARTIPDATINNGLIQITESTALAGAVASIRYKGFELIASGGHGSAVQDLVRYWDDSETLAARAILTPGDECRNPTEAGNMNDDSGQTFPYHGQSSSGIIFEGSATTAGGFPMLYSKTNMPYYIPYPSTPEAYNGSAPCKRGDAEINVPVSSFFLMNKNVTLGWTSPVTGTTYNNVIVFDIWTEVPRAVQNARQEYIAYLSRYFTKEHFLNLKTNDYYAKGHGQAKDAAFVNTTNNPTVRMFSDDNGGLTIGLLSATPTSTGYYQDQVTYTATDADLASSPHVFRVAAADTLYSGVPANGVIAMKVFMVISADDTGVHGLDQVSSIMREIAKATMPELIGASNATAAAATTTATTSATSATSTPNPAQVGIYRKYSASQLDHLYTADSSEASDSYSLDGRQFTLDNDASRGSTQALYRCFRQTGHGYDHYLTTTDCGGGVKDGALGFIAESQITGTVPLYSCYGNSGSWIEHHLATTTLTECSDIGMDNVGIFGYVQKG